MSRKFVDDDLLTWEAYSSASRRVGDRPAILFLCLSDLSARARFVELDGDSAQTERLVHTLSDAELRALLSRATPVR